MTPIFTLVTLQWEMLWHVKGGQYFSLLPPTHLAKLDIIKGAQLQFYVLFCNFICNLCARFFFKFCNAILFCLPKLGDPPKRFSDPKRDHNPQSVS